MGTVCAQHESSGRQHQGAEGGIVRQAPATHRRPLVRLRYYGLQVRRHPTVFRQRRRRTQGDQEGDRVTTARVGNAEEVGRSAPPEVSEAGCRSTVFVPAGPLQSTGCNGLFRVQPVSKNRTVVFDDRVVVHELTDWPAEDYTAARVGPWMQIAVDRYRFKRRIGEIEQLLSKCLTVEHRDIAVSRFEN